MTKKLVFALFMLLTAGATAQQKVINLYNGVTQNNGSRPYDEKIDSSFHFPAVYNVSRPTLTVYLPDPAIATGTSIIVCPGGGFYILSMRDEGTAVADWLTKKGITVFILKYRLAKSQTDNAVAELNENMKKTDFADKIKPAIPLAIADGREAIKYVRAHAAEYNLSPGRVGIMGFSAGGTVAAGTAYNYTAENKPDFVAPVYGYIPPYIKSTLATDEPPLFLTVATDDRLGLVPNSIDIYNEWHAAGHDAELHVYEKGGHGFGMNKQNIPTDTWIERFYDWLNLEGFCKPIDPKVAANIAEREKNHKFFDELPRKDWAYIQRYDADNSKLVAAAPNDKRVVFMGNSITDSWIGFDPDFFSKNHFIDRGISGQTTGQMLVRFREDVINLHPAAVVILAGVNDIAENNGPSKLEDVFGNIESMVQLALAANIKVVLSSVLPAFDFPWKKGMQPIPKIARLNGMIKEYAQKNGLVYLDYFSAMADERNGLPVNLSKDGVHPNLAGYKIMEPLAEQAIRKALAKEK